MCVPGIKHSPQNFLSVFKTRPCCGVHTGLTLVGVILPQSLECWHDRLFLSIKWDQWVGAIKLQWHQQVCVCVPRDLPEAGPASPTRAEITVVKGGEMHSNIFLFFPVLLSIKWRILKAETRGMWPFVYLRQFSIFPIKLSLTFPPSWITSRAVTIHPVLNFGRSAHVHMQRQGRFKGCPRFSWQLLCYWDKSYSLQWICYSSWNPGLCGNHTLRITRNMCLWSIILRDFLSFFYSFLGGFVVGSELTHCEVQALHKNHRNPPASAFAEAIGRYTHQFFLFRGMEMEPRAFHIRDDAPTTSHTTSWPVLLFLPPIVLRGF